MSRQNKKTGSRSRDLNGQDKFENVEKFLDSETDLKFSWSRVLHETALRQIKAPRLMSKLLKLDQKYQTVFRIC